MNSTRLRHNIGYNILGSAIPIAATILTVPAYIRLIGEARYGVLALLWGIFGYFGVFDFGLSRATAHRLATLRDAPMREQAGVFYTACALNLSFGVIAAAVFYVSADPILSRLLPHSGDLRPEVLAALPLIVAFFPLGLVSGVLTGCLEANERFLQLNAQQAAGSILWQCLPLAMVWAAGPSLYHAVLGAVIARGLSTAALAAVCLHWAWPAGPPRVDRRHVRELLRYGGWTTVTNTLGPVLTSVDQFIIGALLGPRALAHYNVPYSMATKALIPPAAFTRALFPRLSHASRREAEALSRKALLILSGLMAAACAPAILLAGFGLQAWVGSAFAAASRLPAELLLIGVWINGVGLFPYTLLQAQGRPEVIARIHALELAPFIVVLWAAIQFWGLPGAAAAWTLRVAADGALLFAATRLGVRLLVELLAPASALFAALFISQWVRPGLVGALAWSAALALIPLAWMYVRRRALGVLAPKRAVFAREAVD
jgi:O-antigen/teichoic acid export membrane protein